MQNVCETFLFAGRSKSPLVLRDLVGVEDGQRLTRNVQLLTRLGLIIFPHKKNIQVSLTQ